MLRLFGMIITALAAALAGPLAAQTVPVATVTEGTIAQSPVERWTDDPMTVFQGSEVDLTDFQWIARPVIVFANTEADPSFQDQMRMLLARPEPLIARDVVLIADTDPGGQSDVRLQLRPRGFMLALLGKDGGVKQRKPLPWDVRELTRVIDKFPLRQREMHEQTLGQ